MIHVLSIILTFAFVEMCRLISTVTELPYDHVIHGCLAYLIFAVALAVIENRGRP